MIRDADVLCGKGIAGDRIFFQRRAPHALALHHLDAYVVRVGEQHLVFGNFDALEAVLLPAVAHPFGKQAIARRAGDVRLGGQKRMRLARPGRRRHGDEAAFDGTLGGGGAGSEAVNCGRRGCARRGP